MSSKQICVFKTSKVSGRNGLFCKNACTLEDLSEKIDGYLEEISEVTFNNLVTLNHPSIYHGHAGNTQRQRWFVFFEHPYDVEVESVYTG